MKHGIDGGRSWQAARKTKYCRNVVSMIRSLEVVALFLFTARVRADVTMTARAGRGGKRVIGRSATREPGM
jgi:hypothetical protein